MKEREWLDIARETEEERWGLEGDRLGPVVMTLECTKVREKERRDIQEKRGNREKIVIRRRKEKVGVVVMVDGVKEDERKQLLRDQGSPTLRGRQRKERERFKVGHVRGRERLKEEWQWSRKVS